MKTSPKQPQPERHRDWYPYYAGFTEQFVGEVLDTYAKGARSVIDPWNGSGTTTVVCAGRSIAAVGVDINPALTVIARARLTPCSIADSLGPLGLEIVEAAKRQLNEPDRDDLLLTWMRPSAVSRVRSVQAAIHTVLSDVPARDSRSQLEEIGKLAETMPLLACFYYSALCAVCRDLLALYRSTNPTWLVSPRTARHRIAPSWDSVCEGFAKRIQYLRSRLSLSEEPRLESKPVIRTASATELPFESNSYSVAITSPPYATRIDYVKGVLPELAVLGVTEDGVASLRRASTGSPVVSGLSAPTKSLNSRLGRSVLEAIRDHSSKGSRGYYFPWMSRYFQRLQAGLVETSRVVSGDGPVCVIVQDSHYKEVHVDLQRIVVETMEVIGRPLRVRKDFAVKHHRARMNPRARQHLPNRQSTESLLVFG